MKYEVEVDCFQEIAPDDQRKCLRKFVFASFAKDKLRIDNWHKAEQETKTTVFEKNTTCTEFDRRIG